MGRAMNLVLEAYSNSFHKKVVDKSRHEYNFLTGALESMLLYSGPEEFCNRFISKRKKCKPINNFDVKNMFNLAWITMAESVREGNQCKFYIRKEGKEDRLVVDYRMIETYEWHESLLQWAEPFHY